MTTDPNIPLPYNRDGAPKEIPWGTRRWFENQFLNGGSDPSDYYSHACNGYQQYRHGKTVLLLQRNSGSSQVGRILDIGCALGDLGERVSSLFPGATLVGIDFAPSVVQGAATAHSDSDFLVSSLPFLPFSDGSFDLVLASEVIYYLPNAGRVRAIEEIRRVLAVGGQLMFTSALDDGRQYFSAAGALDLLSGRLEIIAVEYDHNRAYHFMERVLVRLAAFRHWLRFGGAFPTKKQWAVTRAILRIERVPLLRAVFLFLLGLLTLPNRFVLRLQWLPAAMSGLSRFFQRDRTVTNVAIIATKRQ